ncbi:MAG: hydrogen peroxide-inducible genes activator [Neomegalonema sp.]|nr:hydrogen peroxide-inducible genes activator [Neomegalonema sp.]
METADVTLKQLRALLAVDQAGSFRRAAEALRVAQPSLSAQIQALEKALGQRLVERSRSGALLSPAGREIADRARRVIDAVTALTDYAAELHPDLAGSLKLGVSPTIGPYLLPTVVAQLRRDHPELKLHIREGPPSALADQLAQGEHDAILTQLPLNRTELIVEELFRERLFLTLAADHPLSAATTVAVGDLAELEVLSLEPHYLLHAQVADLCETFGARIARGYEGASLDALRLMTGMGVGVAFLPALYVRSEIRPGSEVTARAIRGRAITRPIGLAWRRAAGQAPAFQKLAEIVRAVFRELDAEVSARGVN